MNTNTARILLIAALCAYAPLSLAAPVTVPMHLIDANGTGKSVGTVRAEDSKDGLVLMPRLEGLPPGAHGFHVHENPSCAPMEKDGKKTAGLTAGGHYDPDKSGKHAGPTGKGHLGDLPALTVDDKGMTTKRLVAPRLKVADLVGRSLMIHEGGDNYADEPKPWAEAVPGLPAALSRNSPGGGRFDADGKYGRDAGSSHVTADQVLRVAPGSHGPRERFNR